MFTLTYSRFYTDRFLYYDVSFSLLKKHLCEGEIFILFFFMPVITDQKRFGPSLIGFYTQTFEDILYQ